MILTFDFDFDLVLVMVFFGWIRGYRFPFFLLSFICIGIERSYNFKLALMGSVITAIYNVFTSQPQCSLIYSAISPPFQRILLDLNIFL